MKSYFTKLQIVSNWFDRSSPVFASRVSLIVCILLAVFGITIGMLEDSLAVQTNGLIAIIDIVNSMIFLTAVNHTIKTPDFIYNYGYGKYESLGILIGSFLLLAIVVYTIPEIITSLSNEYYTKNYYLLLGFSLLSFFVMRKMSNFQKKASEKHHISIFEYDSALWKFDSYIELGVIGNLIVGLLLTHGKFEFFAKIIDVITAVILIFLAAKVPIKYGKQAINELLDKTLPENIQFDIIAAVAENANRMCEFKNVNTRKSGKDIFIEIEIIMPYDYTLDEAYKIENDLFTPLKEKYPTLIPKLYMIPCNMDCVHGDIAYCPIKTSLKIIQK